MNANYQGSLDCYDLARFFEEADEWFDIDEFAEELSSSAFETFEAGYQIYDPIYQPYEPTWEDLVEYERVVHAA